MRSALVVERGGADAEEPAPGPTATPRLPLQLSSFVGREREIAAIRQLLGSARLLTLTGAGGSGKTRLALEVAARERAAYADGVVWIELAPVSDPSIIPEAVAAPLQVRWQAGHSTMEALGEVLREKCLLLLLDNCEHLVEACAVLVERLLRACPNLRVLATSREALEVPGEIAWLVPPLSLPRDCDAGPAELEQSEAGQLFSERARAVLPSFALTEANAAAVAQICRRLDGIPLAIELAAARLRVLSPAQIASRLDDRFRLLTSGTRTAIPRHQTLRAAIDWSYALLCPQERLLLDRLSVFAGSFSLEAAEAICAGDPLARDDALDLISELIEKSLVEVVEWREAVRYRLLESVDQYGTERLESRGEADELQRRHAGFFLALAEQAEPHLTGSQRAVWLEAMKLEGDNFRAALVWSRVADTELHLRLIGSLRMVWLALGSYREARHWLETALTLPGAADPTRGRAAALLTAGVLAVRQMDNAPARLWLEESERLWHDFGDARLEGYAQVYRAVARLGEDLDTAMRALHGARERFRVLGEKFGESIALTGLAMGMQIRSDHTGAIAVLEENVPLARELGIAQNTALVLQFLAGSLLHRGEPDRAADLLREALTALRQDPELAYTARAVGLLASITARRGSALDAARLFGAAETVRARIGAGIPFFDGPVHDAGIAAARHLAGETAFALAWADGEAMTPEQAIDFALGLEVVPPATEPAAAAPLPGAARTMAPPALRVWALGPLEIECDGVALDADAWRHARPRELLLYLMCHPEGRSREQIGLALWPEASAVQLKNNFHVTLHNLRKVLACADWVQHDHDRYRINPERSYEFDAAQFEAAMVSALRQSRAGPPPLAQLREVLSLYRGDFLDGEVVGDWHCEHRDHLRRLHVEGLLALGGALFATAQYHEAAEVYQRITLRADLHEEAHRRLMICHARMGERTLAMRHYRRFVQLLHDELDTEPERETTDLFERLQRGESL